MLLLGVAGRQRQTTPHSEAIEKQVSWCQRPGARSSSAPPIIPGKTAYLWVVRRFAFEGLQNPMCEYGLSMAKPEQHSMFHGIDHRSRSDKPKRLAL